MENEKSKYVNGALGIAVKAIADVERLEYWAHNGEEYVTIHYINGHKAHICITADSLTALENRPCAFDEYGELVDLTGTGLDNEYDAEILLENSTGQLKWV